MLYPAPLNFTDIDYADLLATEMLLVVVADLDGEQVYRRLL